MQYIDAHSHLHGKEYDHDRAVVLARMREDGVGPIVVGTDISESRKAVALAELNSDIWATIGQHPTDNHVEDFDADAYRELAESNKVVAIGECGLDYFRLKAGREVEEKARQKELFLNQLALAIELDKPLMIHCRPSKGTEDAHEDMLEILFSYSRELENKGGVSELRGAIHFFTGSPEVAVRYIELGFYISFPGVITFAPELADTVRVVPLSSMLAETDSPYATPVPFRGERNEPVHVRAVVEKISQLKNEEEGMVAKVLLANSSTLFNIRTNI